MARTRKEARAVTTRMIKAGLRRALMEDGACRVNHMKYLVMSGYTYCPFCAEELVIQFHCEHCGHNFTSEAGYKSHLDLLGLFSANPCPSQRDGETAHTIRWLKNRRRFYCAKCKHEYEANNENLSSSQ